MSQHDHILSSSWLTANLTVEEAEALLTRCSLRVLQEGERLFEAGAASHDLWFVRSGAVELTAEGVTITKPVRVHHPATLCDMSLLSPGPHTVTATAVEPTRLYGLSHEAFLALKHDAPSCAAKLLRAIAPTLAARLRSCNDRTESATVERQLNLASAGTTLGGPGGGHLQAMAEQLLAEGSRAPSTTRMPSQSQEARGSDRARPVTQKMEAEPEKPGMFGRFKQAIVGKPDPKGNG